MSPIHTQYTAGTLTGTDNDWSDEPRYNSVQTAPLQLQDNLTLMSVSMEMDTTITNQQEHEFVYMDAHDAK